jgi:uncharacterized membrane protein YbaN (DUF454 family)
MKQLIWNIFGCLLVGMGYIGLITPGIPFSIFIIGAAYCFSKGSPTMHQWLHNHILFGSFLRNWTEKKVFPTKMKYMMITMMASSLVIMCLTTSNSNVICYTGIMMVLVSIWAWRYPGSNWEYNNRIILKKRIGWLN